ncbi:hypothetical protein [Paracoccus beibuensis]|uniref:hypothetical protein n=1 Tax=Paracoccus beibuensis TaxID=547602 RepID=UPI002240D2E7|nr:hypothetical protein [Paracoccus beibuensis]
MNQHAAHPEFAMSFTQEAVQLEYRDGPGWQVLGQAPFSGRDIAGALHALRLQAGPGVGEPDTVLVIPDDQILYTVLTVPFGSDTAATIAKALEASTPYHSGDLAFDWCPAANGDIETLRVAAVARRTLDEAEEFARAQGFRPSGFQARPGDDRFDGQPDFGPSRLAQDQVGRRPFSEPDLTQARVTAPRIEVEQSSEAVGPVLPVVSRIIPHVVMEDREAAPPAAVAQAPTVEGGSAVIRHGQGPLTAKRLSPRAEAVHSRAAAARAQRSSVSTTEIATSGGLVSRLRGMDPARLPIMVAALALVLVAALIYFGRPVPEPATAPDVAETVAPAPQVATAPATEPEPAPTEAPSGQDALSRALAEAMADPEDAAVPQAPAAVDAAAAEPVAPEVAPAPAMPLAPTAEASAEADLPQPFADAPDAGDLGETGASIAGPAAEIVAEAAPTASTASAPDAVAPQPAPVADATQAAPATGTAPPATTAIPATAASAPQAPTAARPAGRLATSQRPPRATPASASAPALPDSRPRVPSNPLPYDAATQTQPARPSGSRPPARPTPAAAEAPAPAAAAPSPAPAPAPTAARPPSPTQRQAAPAAAEPAAPIAAGSPRPPSRPANLSQLEEGSTAEDDQPRRLTEAEKDQVRQQLRDLRTAQADAAPLSKAERGLVFQLADARPSRKPVSLRAPSQQAVENAVSEAVASSRPASRASTAAVEPAPSASAGIGRSARPRSKPGGGASADAVEAAIASAIEQSPASPGAVALTALTSSALPPRRAAGAAVNAMVATAAPVAAAVPSSADLRAAAEAQAMEASRAEQLRQDAELQAQAEARARSQAAADARAEAQARAAAEARARAQAEAEARAAAARNQNYRPPEVDNEPDVVAAVPQNAVGNAGASATVSDGIRLNSTQIIGTIGAGQASRALVRLSNGRVLTLRLGDRINGGTITAIGDSRITYRKGNQAHALGVLNGQ